jgi:hypothetical protein
MSLDFYREAAISAAAQIGEFPAVIALTTSNSALSTAEHAAGLAAAFVSLKYKTAVASPADTPIPLRKEDEVQALLLPAAVSPAEAERAVAAFSAERDVTLLVLPPLRESETAMLYASACKKVILFEKKKSSRTDQIDAVMESLAALSAKPLGFILL